MVIKAISYSFWRTVLNKVIFGFTIQCHSVYLTIFILSELYPHCHTNKCSLTHRSSIECPRKIDCKHNDVSPLCDVRGVISKHRLSAVILVVLSSVIGNSIRNERLLTMLSAGAIGSLSCCGGRVSNKDISDHFPL